MTSQTDNCSICKIIINEEEKTFVCIKCDKKCHMVIEN